MKPTLKKNPSLFLVTLILCSLVFMKNADAQQNPQPVACADGNATNYNPYAGIDDDIDTIFDHPQLLHMPQVQITNDFQILPAPNLTPCTTAPYKDPVLSYAAQLFCNEMAPSIPDPFYSMPPGQPRTAAQIQAQRKYDQYIRQAAAVYALCMHEVDRRTAYAQSDTSMNNFNGNMPTPYTIQNIQCHLIKDPPAGAAAAQANGATPSPTLSTNGDASNYSIGVNSTKNPEIDGALLECDTFGLSQEAQVWARHHRCDDHAFVGLMAGVYDGTALDAAKAECHKEAAAYDAEVLQRKAALQRAIDNLQRLTGG